MPSLSLRSCRDEKLGSRKCAHDDVLLWDPARGLQYKEPVESAPGKKSLAESDMADTRKGKKDI